MCGKFVNYTCDEAINKLLERGILKCMRAGISLYFRDSNIIRLIVVHKRKYTSILDEKKARPEPGENP